MKFLIIEDRSLIPFSRKMQPLDPEKKYIFYYGGRKFFIENRMHSCEWGPQCIVYEDEVVNFEWNLASHFFARTGS